MPTVLIEVRKPRSQEAEADLIREIPREDWGIRGGRAGSDVELGFEIEV